MDVPSTPKEVGETWHVDAFSGHSEPMKYGLASIEKGSDGPETASAGYEI